MAEPDEPLTPRRNPDLVGHDRGEARFLAAWSAGRLPHGWLICGPKGIGKATFAFRAARFLFANGTQGGDPPEAGLFGEPEPPPAPESLFVAPDAPVFRRVASGGHADLLTVARSVDPKTDKLRSEITVADVRPAGDFLRLTPAEGGWRVVVIDSVDEMNATAANALLKFLEEPPSRAVLLLVSHAPGRLLATIRSRCSRIDLRPLPEESVAAILAAHRPDLAPDDRASLARLADGSPGRAIALVDGGGLTLYREMIRLMGALPALDGKALHGFADRLARSGQEDSFRTVCTLMRWWIARMIRSGAEGRQTAPVVAEEEGCQTRLLAAAGLDRWLEVWEKIGRLAAQTDGLNLDRKQSLLSIFHTLQGAVIS